jgi:phosphatidylserine decarboxylase
VISARSWTAARRYVLPPAAFGVARVVRHQRGGGAALVIAGVVALFFRDPQRPLDPDTDVVYAAADGVVKAVDRVRDPWISGGDALRISTFLSLSNVHVNRSPVAGTVVRVEEIPGRSLPAFLDCAPHANRRDRLMIDTPRGPVVTLLATGILARRISRWVSQGDRVAAGQRIALIHFGSRTDVLLRAGTADPLVRAGDRVRAGATPLARYSSLAREQKRDHAEDEQAAPGDVEDVA